MIIDKQEFIDIYKDCITRQGSEELLKWLETTDFFYAPCSTKFHLSCRGGLVTHSVNVYNTLIERFFDEENDNMESFAIVSLLHDVCKANYYKESTRNVKNEMTGAWEKVPYYAIDDQFPFGHGEKSVFLIERFMRLKIDEAAAIRWHMGPIAEKREFTCGEAFYKYPLACKLHLADMESTYLLETR